MTSQPVTAFPAPKKSSFGDLKSRKTAFASQRAIIIEALASALVESYLEDQSNVGLPGDSPTGTHRKASTKAARVDAIHQEMRVEGSTR